MNDCLFCKIIAGAIPGTRVYEDDQVIVIRDIAPMAKEHLLVIPRKHMASVAEAEEQDQALLGHMLLTARKVAKDLGISESGFRLVINTGKHGAQSVAHLHMHILGGEQLSEKLC